MVQLADGDGLPVAGHDVVFRFTDDLPDAAVDPGSATTDAAGQAGVRARLGSQAGSQAIEAVVAVPGQDLRVRFRLTATSVDAADGSDGGSGGKGNGGGSGGGSAGGGSGSDGSGGGGNGNGHPKGGKGKDGNSRKDGD